MKLKITSIKNTKRKVREIKPKNIRPTPFYEGSRFGYSWCDECQANNINVLIGNVLTCGEGHDKILLTDYTAKPKNASLVAKREHKRKVEEAPLLFLV